MEVSDARKRRDEATVVPPEADVCQTPGCGHAIQRHWNRESTCFDSHCPCTRYTPPAETVSEDECPTPWHCGTYPCEDFADELPAHIAESMKDPEYAAASADVKRRFALMDTLIALRHDLGLTQGEVATRMGVKQPTVSGFENEGADPRLSTIQRYARAVESEVTMAVAPSRAQAVAEAEAAWEMWSANPHGPMWSFDPEDWPDAAFTAGFLAAKGLDQ